jgi:Kv channel-interacting protein
METSTLETMFQPSNKPQPGTNDATAVGARVEDDEPTLTREQFVAMLKESNHPLAADPDLAASFYNALDVNDDGKVDQKELLMGLVVFSEGSFEKKLKLSFSVFDINGDGFLQTDELLKVLRIVAELNGHGDTPEAREQWAQAFVETFMGKFDENDDGQLSFEEFEIAARQDKELQAAFSIRR